MGLIKYSESETEYFYLWCHSRATDFTAIPSFCCMGLHVQWFLAIYSCPWAIMNWVVWEAELVIEQVGLLYSCPQVSAQWQDYARARVVKTTGASEGTFPPKNKEWVIVTVLLSMWKLVCQGIHQKMPPSSVWMNVLLQNAQRKQIHYYQ